VIPFSFLLMGSLPIVIRDYKMSSRSAIGRWLRADGIPSRFARFVRLRRRQFR
jgi:DNA recombination-dependent growth factor C